MNKLTNEDLDLLKIEEEENSEGIGIKRYAFNSFKIERSVRDILNWVDKGKIIIPEFQRDFVWSYNQSCKLIESILLGLPIPDFFMFRIIDSIEKIEKYILIDGLQRYTTIKQFFDGEFEQGEIIKKFKINDKASIWYGKDYKSLDVKDQDFFQDFSLKINVFDSLETNEKTQKLYMTSIFERINTGSSKLSNQEVRNAIYSGAITMKLKEDVKYSSFKTLLQGDEKKYSQRCKNEEFLLRLMTYYHVYKQKKDEKNTFIDEDNESKLSSSKELMLCSFLYYCNNNKINYDEYSGKLKLALDTIVKFNETAFCTIKRDLDEVSSKTHELFAEALVIALMIGVNINITKEKLDESKLKIWKDREKYSEFFVSTTDLNNIIKRVETVKLILSGEIN